MAHTRPNSTFEKTYVAQAKRLCLLGATDLEVAQFFGVNRGTLYDWQRRHTDFAKAMTSGKEVADNRVERSLYNRAVGYDFEAVKIFCDKGDVTEVPYMEHVPPDTKAAMFWLQNRRPDLWRNQQDLNLKGEVTLRGLLAESFKGTRADG